MNINYIRLRYTIIGFAILTLVAILIGALNPAWADSFDGQVSRAFFTTRLKNKEPANEVLILENNNRNVFFFSEVQNMKGKIIFHRWEYGGEMIHEKKFQVATNSEKLLSKYKLSPDSTGEWMVVIADERGWPIKAVMFKYVNKGSFAGKGIVPIKQ